MTGTFTSINGLTYTVNVGSASGTLTLGEDPVHISWKDGEHIFVPVRTRECSIRVKSSEDLSHLYTDDPLGCEVTVTLGNNCIFFGYLTPQVWDAPYRGVHDEVELVAVDALAALKQLKYMAKEGDYPSLLSAQSILARGCATVGITGVPTLTGGSAENINEMAFLPRYQDVSEYSEERTSWGDVMQAIATWMGVVLMLDPMDGYTLEAVNLQAVVEEDTPADIELRGEDSAGADVRMSIEPAKSRVVVNYKNLSEQPIFPEINADRMQDTCIETTSVVDGGKRTTTRYYVSKDWVSTDSRTACAAIAVTKDRMDDDEEEHSVIVGPAIMQYPGINRRETSLDWKAVKVTFKAWARDDMDVTVNGYEELSIKTEASNFDPVVTFRISDPILGNCTHDVTLDLNGKEGMTECTCYLNDWFSDTPGKFYTGYIRIVVPAHCVISDLQTEMSPKYFAPLAAKKVDLSKVENDGIIELKSAGWNDRVTIDAVLRPNYSGYAAADVVVTDPTQTNFPYCVPEQFEEPRRRYKGTLRGVFDPLEPVVDADLSTKVMLVDGGDLDLRMARTTVSLIETWQDAE